MGHQAPFHDALVRLLLSKPKVTATNAAMALGEGLAGLAAYRWFGAPSLSFPIFGFAVLKLMKGTGLAVGCLVGAVERWRKARSAGRSEPS